MAFKVACLLVWLLLVVRSLLPPFHSLLPSAGFFFLFLSGIITWRVLTFAQAANRKPLLGLSILMGCAGLICIFYQRHWFFSLTAAARVPIYTLIGISLTFALCFAIAELLNFASSSGGGSGSSGGRGVGGAGAAPVAQSALVQTPQQVVLLAVASVLLGCVLGFVFGIAEIGKGVFTMHTLRVRQQLHRGSRGRRGGDGRQPLFLMFLSTTLSSFFSLHCHLHVSPSLPPLPFSLSLSPTPPLQTQFIHEERICLPIGAVLGAVTGYLNERLRPGADKEKEDVGSARRGMSFGSEARAAFTGSSYSTLGGNNGSSGSSGADADAAEDDDFDPFGQQGGKNSRL